MAFEDFRKSVLKVKSQRNHKIKGSLGVRDAFKWLQKNKLLNIGRSLKEEEFYKIIRTVNNLLAKELLKGKDVKLPQKMGMLEVRKYDTYVRLQDGKIKTNRKVDWNATLKLWYENEEAKEEKLLVRLEDKEVFKIFYNRMIANYKNKTLFQFKPHRELSIKVREAGKEGIIDAFKIGH